MTDSEKLKEQTRRLVEFRERLMSGLAEMSLLALTSSLNGGFTVHDKSTASKDTLFAVLACFDQHFPELKDPSE